MGKVGLGLLLGLLLPTHQLWAFGQATQLHFLYL